jgi:carboxyl-terminal processing protease
MHHDTTPSSQEKVTPPRSSGKPLLAVALALLLATGTFFSGLHIGGTTSGAGATGLSLLLAGDAVPDPNADLKEFWRVWDLLDEKFAMASGTDLLTPEEKVAGAIEGLVRAYGDPYTTYFPPQEASAFNEDISGNFSGVGMEVGMRNNLLTIISPLPGTPAEKAGLLAGDTLVAINGSTTEGMGVDEAVRLIRGPEGTEVILSIYRPGMTTPTEYKVTRAQIEVPTVKTEKRGDTFIITLYSFNALAEMKMQQALREYVASGADKLVLDLRGNPGGYLQGAVSIASYFMPAGKVVLRESFGDEREEEIYRSQGKTLKQFAPKEIVVLIDGGSASASEILAGALQEQGFATVVGTASFGKGSVQELVNLPSGSSLKVTIARWLTPNGRSISNGGLEPDIKVERTLEDREANRDPQLDAALEVLRGTYVAPPAATTTSSN